MEELSSIWILGLAALLAGVVIGLLMARGTSGGRSRSQLVRDLEESRRELAEYRQSVSIHFAHTADLVNRLTDSYRDVHHQLSRSAQELCDDETLVARLMEEEKRPVLGERKPSPPPSGAPKDYAPRTDKEAGGTLAQDYGLSHKDKRQTETEAPGYADAASETDWQETDPRR